jgi:hypothetical protein
VPIKIKIQEEFEPSVSKVPITQLWKKWALPTKNPTHTIRRRTNGTREISKKVNVLTPQKA